MGGTGPRAGCSPSAESSAALIASDAEAAGRAGGLFQLQSAPRLTDRALRSALFADRTNSTAPARRSIAEPWREATTRSDRVCDHARGHSRGRSRHAVPVSVGAGELLDATGAVRKGARNLHRVFIGRRTRLCGSRSRAQGAPRCFARACARLAALTARAATRVLATIDGQNGSA